MRAEPKRLHQAPTLKVLSNPESIARSVKRHYDELGYILDEDDAAALIADPVCQDCPIVGVSRGFVQLTGFSREYLLGKNCRVLLNNVPEVAISKSARKNLRDFCRMCRFVGLSQISETSSVQPNARQDGSQFMNFFMVGLCSVDRHPFILGVQMTVGEGILARLSNKQVKEVSEESRATMQRLRSLLCQGRGLPAPSPEPGLGQGFRFYGERLQDHCTLFSQNRTVLRREPHELATNCLVFGDAPAEWTGPGLFFAVLVDDVVSTFNGLPLLGFTKRKPADVVDLYPPVTKCMGASVLVGACGEAFARDKHDHFCIGFRAPPSSEVMTWTLQRDMPSQRGVLPQLDVQPGDELGCLYTRGGRLQLWRNRRKFLDFDLGRPPEAGVDYYAVIDVCFAVYCLTLISRPPPVEAEQLADADVAAGVPPTLAPQPQPQRGPPPARRVAVPAPASAQASAQGPALAQRTEDLAAGPRPQRDSGTCNCHGEEAAGQRCSGQQGPCAFQGHIDRESVVRAIKKATAECGFSVSVANPEGECALLEVSEEFVALTGYQRNEILGKNCRFLNDGCWVSSQDQTGLRVSSCTGAPFTALLPNRKKSGEMFVNLLDLQGLAVAHDSKTGKVLWYCVGIQADVTGIDDEMIPERHSVQYLEVARRVRQHLRKEAARPQHNPQQGYQLLEEPLWMHGKEWIRECKDRGIEPMTIAKLHPTMSPGLASRLARGCSAGEERLLSKSSAQEFSRRYSKKAAHDEWSRKWVSLPGVWLRRSEGVDTALGMLKGWLAVSLPAISAICLFAGGVLCRRWWR